MAKTSAEGQRPTLGCRTSDDDDDDDDDDASNSSSFNSVKSKASCIALHKPSDLGQSCMFLRDLFKVVTKWHI
jgi:hypothetical protein